MERELKKVSLSIVMSQDKPRIEVQAYTTSVGGLVVAPLHEIIWQSGSERVIKRNRNWCIWTYPSGFRALGGFPEKQQAIDFCASHLTKYSWVALMVDDIRSNNDMDAMRKDFGEYRKFVENLRR